MNLLTFCVDSSGDVWDALAAVGTAAAVFVALFFGLRDGRHRTREADARAKIAKVALWADLRAMFTAFRLLREHEVVQEGRTEKLEFDRKTSLAQIIGQLQEQDARVYQMAVDLHDDDGLVVAKALSHARHVVRHTVQLNMYDGSFTPSQFETKRKAILSSCTAGRALLKPLCDSAYALLKESRP